MNYADWYTDRMDVYRTEDVKDGSLTRKKRVLVLSNVPCRVYQTDNRPIHMEETAAHVDQADKLTCDNAVDLRAGDELHVYRGKGLGQSREHIRAFAGVPNYYFEPFGAVIPGLAHQEVRMMQQERVK